MEIQSGDLTPCLNLSYANCSRNFKHYNVSISTLPKNQYYHGNDNIEEWRRLE